MVQSGSSFHEWLIADPPMTSGNTVRYGAKPDGRSDADRSNPSPSPAPSRSVPKSELTAPDTPSVLPPGDRWADSQGPEAVDTTSETATHADLTLAPADYQALLEEVARAQAIDRQRLTRIHHLEQALDQATTWLAELKQQLQDQAFLENQLAATEDYAQMQQQVIAHLKLQLVDQQSALDVQILETRQRDQAIQELMATIESMTQAQQREIERLRFLLAQEHVETQTYRTRQNQHLQDLRTTLDSRQQRIAELESETLMARTLAINLQGQLDTAQQQVKELSVKLRQQSQPIPPPPAQPHRPDPESTATVPAITSGKSLSALPLAIQRGLSALDSSGTPAKGGPTATGHLTPSEGRLATVTGTPLPSWSPHLLEDDRDRQQRLQQLEQQAAEMQEQILHQAQQAAEYETAVQYWKDRHSQNQQQLQQVRELLEQAAGQGQTSEGTAAEWLKKLSVMITTSSPDSMSPPSPRLTSPAATPELPDFLIRRRLGGARSSSKSHR